jgi:hypothetical protein
MRTTILKNYNANIGSISGHSFKFSDGSELEGQLPELVAKFDIKRETIKVGELAGMPVYQQKFTLTEDQLLELELLGSKVTLVIVPVILLDALRQMQQRDDFPYLVAFNATKETQRSAPADKIVDIENWSY